MLMIRLQRLGRKHDPSYRIVVTDKAAGPKAGKYVEELGHYDARREKGAGKDVTINADRAKYWISVGAEPSGTVHNIFVREGIIAGKKKDVRPSKTVKKEEIAQTKQTAQTAQTAQTNEPMTETVETKEEENEERKEEVPAEVPAA